MYYFVAGIWHLLCQGYDENQYKAIKERIEKDENYLLGLLQKWDFNTENRLNPIYKALFEALKSERASSTPEQRKSESVQETNEDYPPEPYNESGCSKVNSHGAAPTKRKNMHPNYLRQKVFPTELFYARRKISRFKPRYFVRYTNYRLLKESALGRKRNGNTSVYRVLIRGETKNNILTCRKTCFRL